MVDEAKEFEAQDNAARERVDARNGLETYCYGLKNSLAEGKLSDEDKATVEAKVQETMNWLDTAEHAEKEEFESMQKELEEIVNPILQKSYNTSAQQEGPGAAPQQGPTVEEVD